MTQIDDKIQQADLYITENGVTWAITFGSILSLWNVSASDQLERLLPIISSVKATCTETRMVQQIEELCYCHMAVINPHIHLSGTGSHSPVAVAHVYDPLDEKTMTVCLYGGDVIMITIGSNTYMVVHAMRPQPSLF